MVEHVPAVRAPMTTSRYGHAGSWPSSSPAGSSTGGSWSVAGSGGARPGMVGRWNFTPNQIWPPSSAGPYGPPTYGVFGATWGIDSINKFNAEACNKSSTRDSEREHGADEAYEQLKQVERWPRLERERRGEHSQGDIACASSSATTSIAPPSSSRSPTATEDALLGGEPWGCQ